MGRDLPCRPTGRAYGLARERCAQGQARRHGLAPRRGTPMTGSTISIQVPKSHTPGSFYRRVAIVGREEYRRALESRWLFGFAALLTALILGLSFFGLAQGREVGFQGFVRV